MTLAASRDKTAWPTVTVAVRSHPQLNVHDCTCRDGDCEGGEFDEAGWSTDLQPEFCLYCQLLPSEMPCPGDPDAEPPGEVSPRPTRIYVASSWRNQYLDYVHRHIKEVGGLAAYDFRAQHGFDWRKIDNRLDWAEKCSLPEYVEGLKREEAQRGFQRDKDELDVCDALLLVGPCGRSAHLELGYSCGRKPTAVWLPERQEPELMYLLADQILITLDDLVGWLAELKTGRLRSADASD